MNLSPPASTPSSIANDEALAFRAKAAITGAEGQNEDNFVASSAQALLFLARSSSDDSGFNTAGSNEHISPKSPINLPNNDFKVAPTALLQQESNMTSRRIFSIW